MRHKITFKQLNRRRRLCDWQEAYLTTLNGLNDRQLASELTMMTHRNNFTQEESVANDWRLEACKRELRTRRPQDSDRALFSKAFKL